MHLPEAQPQGRLGTTRLTALQRVVPVAVAHVHRPHGHPVAAGILQQAAGRIEAHRLGIEQRTDEGGGLMALEPAAHVGDQRKRAGMAFRKAIVGKSLQLLEDPLGKRQAVAAFLHATYQALAVDLQVAMTAPGRHRTPQMISLARGVAGGDDGQLHGLLLKERHPQRALEDLAQRLGRIVDRLQPLTTAQVRMHHVALDGAGPDNGHLNDQIVEAARPQPRQHRHLGAGFDLEDPHRVGRTDHVVGGGIIRRDGGRCQVTAAVPRQQRQRLAHAGQHAQRQAIHLQHAQHVQVVLVPLDDGSRRHGRILDGHQTGQRAVGDHEPAHVLRQVPGMVAQRLHQMQQPLHQRRGRIETGLRQLVGHVVAIAAAPEAGPDGRDLIGRKAQCPGHVTRRAAPPVADDIGRERRPRPAVLAVDVLEDLLAPFVLEIHVDVGRLVALATDEALDQHLHPGRVHLDDAQHETDGRICGRTTPLAENALAACKAHDVVNREEVGLIAQVGNQRQLMLDQPDDPFGRPLRPAPAQPLLGQVAQP